MWPFSWLGERGRRRRRNAALVVLIGHYVYETLDAGARARVEAEVDRNMVLNLYPPALARKLERADALAAERALAMERLGMATGIRSMAWRDLLRHAGRRKFLLDDGMCGTGDLRISSILFHLPLFGPDIEEAKSLMRRNGYNVPAWEEAQEYPQIVPNPRLPDGARRMRRVGQ